METVKVVVTKNKVRKLLEIKSVPSSFMWYMEADIVEKLFKRKVSRGRGKYVVSARSVGDNVGLSIQKSLLK